MHIEWMNGWHYRYIVFDNFFFLLAAIKTERPDGADVDAYEGIVNFSRMTSAREIVS